MSKPPWLIVDSDPPPGTIGGDLNVAAKALWDACDEFTDEPRITEWRDATITALRQWWRGTLTSGIASALTAEGRPDLAAIFSATAPRPHPPEDE